MVDWGTYTVYAQRLSPNKMPARASYAGRIFPAGTMHKKLVNGDVTLTLFLFLSVLLSVMANRD